MSKWVKVSIGETTRVRNIKVREEISDICKYAVSNLFIKLGWMSLLNEIFTNLRHTEHT